MKRTTVKIPDALDTRLRHEATRRGVTISQVTREALEAHLGADVGGRFPWAGEFRSGFTDTSQRVEEILREEWGERP
jgi:hypothetical protein